MDTIAGLIRSFRLFRVFLIAVAALPVYTAPASAGSDVTIMGLRVFADNDEYLPPVILAGERITIEFDVDTPLPPRLQIVFLHASKDWMADGNLFVNDPAKIASNTLAYATAPDGVHTYTYRFRNSFPNDRNLVAFEFSGNYLFRIIDLEAGGEILAEGKFIVADSIVPSGMTVTNASLPGATPPWDEVNEIAVSVNAPEEYRADDPRSVLHSDITTVDIIKDWEITRPWRIDMEVHDANTFVENFYRGEKTFRIRNVRLGNEYRRMDLSSITAYPNYQRTAMRGGPDLSRFRWQGRPDANGASKLDPFRGPNGEYIDVELDLRLPQDPTQRIFAVGGFSSWEVLPANELTVDSTTGLYRLRTRVRRGVYDYQYVLADVRDGAIADEDWSSLEGNDWRTLNRYIALVYYHDRRFGGFDRIVGIVHGRSPGGSIGNSITIPVQRPEQTTIPWFPRPQQ